MRAPQSAIKRYCDNLEYCQRKLCLKDNGSNTEEILFLVRCFEQARIKMQDEQDYGAAMDIYESLLATPAVCRLSEKYGVKL